MKVQFVDVNGVRTRYLHEGSGDPILLIHGSSALADNFYLNIDPLGRELAVCAPDLLGHGFTSRIPLEGPVFPYMVDHMAGVVDALGWDRFFLVGWSMGALVAALLYFRMPHRVRKMVFTSNSSCFHTDEGLTRSFKRHARYVLRLLDDPSLDAVRAHHRSMLHPSSPTPEEVLLPHTTSFALPGTRRFFEDVFHHTAHHEVLRAHRIHQQLADIAVPTLVVAGRDDPSIPYAHVEKGARRIPGARLLAFDDCGHLPFYERPDDFNQAVLDFVKEPE